jgi:AcrR family transcriptional regulator
MDATSPPATRREAGKTERRRRIVEAAASLVRELGFEAVSMLQIAERAEVSPATLYNLFQTKATIFQQVFDLDLAAFQARLARVPARDGLDRIFAALDLAAALYRSDPEFYRAMARGGDGGERLGSAISEPRRGFWQAQVSEAVEDGGLSPEADPDVLGGTLSQLMRGIFLEWAAKLISAERLAMEAAYGFALALLAYATEATAPRLRLRLAELQSSLASAQDRRA